MSYRSCVRTTPGITWSFEGSEADMREWTAALKSGFTIAIFTIYALLAVAFGSYVQPLIVLSAIPFGLVVNDSIIMIDYANRRRKEIPLYEAIQEAGLRRFRPIFLTTVTTFGGLTPIILERSLQAQYLIPMAISLGFGIIFATAIILLLVPCLYLSVEEFKLRFRGNNEDPEEGAA